ncbi:uncharacterized protein B0J16DRAFT_406360, partial [Fusarium flagelliforme]|uniref:uncharacterized protein n=1 Tax=Fusarium flagelliforme TaxID=2675880 RepID=UPI001E8CA726
HLALVHIPPVAITLAVLSLYIANVRWSNPTNNALNALQFAAKVHEALIIVSIGNILLGRINHHLLNKGDSLPLGFLPSPLLLNSPFLYLISSELWAPILSSRGQHRTRKATGAMILLSAILCIAASPLSAITMIPRQGWRLVPEFRPFGIPDWMTTYTTGTLYNTDLDAEAVPDHNVTRDSEWYTKPSQRSVLETAIRRLSSGYRPLTNVTYSNFGATGRPMSYRTLSSGGTVATCPPSAVALQLASTYARSGEILKAGNKEAGTTTLSKWKQPLVVTQCTQTRLQDGGIAEFRLNTISGALPIYGDTQLSTPLATRCSKEHDFLNIKGANELPISTDIMFASPPEICFTLCLISARWTEADIWIEPERSSDALSHFDFTNGKNEGNITDYFGTRDFINIQEDWMTGIGSVPTTSANRSSYEEAMDFCMISRKKSDSDSNCLETFLAMHVTDAIAELGEFQKGEFITSVRDYEEANVIGYTRYVYIYSYGFGTSIGIPIAFSVLLFHVLVVLVYIPLLFFSEHLRSRPGWSSLGDLLVLTLNSDVEEDLTKGKASERWTKPVVVRDLGHTGRKDIVVG